MEEMVYTVTEASKIIKTNPTYVYELIKAGLIPVLKLGSYKIRKDTLIDFLIKYEGKDLSNPYEIKELDLEKREESRKGD
jgi:excisionase family DNA binding protein